MFREAQKIAPDETATEVWKLGRKNALKHETNRV